jgi:hypothetical protein
MALLKSLHKVSMETHVWGYSFRVASNTTHTLILCTLHGNRYFKNKSPPQKPAFEFKQAYHWCQERALNQGWFISLEL